MFQMWESGLAAELITGSLLFICMITDIRKKKVYVTVIVIAALLAAVVLLAGNHLAVRPAGGGVAVGAAFLLLGKVTKESIGYGDGLILCVTGACVGGWRNVELLFYALFLSAVVSLILLVMKRVRRKDTIPFVPFLFAGYLAGILI